MYTLNLEVCVVKALSFSYERCELEKLAFLRKQEPKPDAVFPWMGGSSPPMEELMTPHGAPAPNV
jgi:hypothetical protein